MQNEFHVKPTTSWEVQAIHDPANLKAGFPAPEAETMTSAAPADFGLELRNMVRDIDRLQHELDASLTALSSGNGDLNTLIESADQSYGMMMGIKNHLMHAVRTLHIKD